MTSGHPGRVNRVRCTTPHVWFVPHDTPHSAEWHGTAAMLVIYVKREFIREECHCELTRGALAPRFHSFSRII